MTITKNYRLVEVTWLDAQSSLESIFVDEVIKLNPILTKSAGYLISENKDRIILAFMIFDDHLLKHFQIIPKGMVKKIQDLKISNSKQT